MTLELKGVDKRVGSETHLYPTSVSLSDTGFNILLGATLAGKTTLLHLMAGLERPSSGAVWFNGRDVTGVSVQRRKVSMVHQQFINYPTMSVFENIASPLRVAGLPAAEIRHRVHRTADLLRLTPMLDRRPGNLSGGQQQRTALARALVKDSDLVLLDEPLANLDFKLREELREEMPRLFADRHCVVVYATSEPREALLLGGHTLTLHEGRLTQYGPTSETYRRPSDLITAQVFSDPPLNIARVIKSGDQIQVSQGLEWPVSGPMTQRPDGPYTVGIRPHHVTPTPVSGHAVQIGARILIAEISGSESIVHFDVDEHRWISQSHGVYPFQVGEQTSLHVDVDNCLYFDADGARIGE